MRQAKRIGISDLSDELKSMFGSNFKIFPVDYSFVQANLNPQNWEYVKVTSLGDYKNHVYVWDNGWTLIGADDKHVAWSDIVGVPSSLPPGQHNHSIDEVIGLVGELNAIRSLIDSKVTSVSGKTLSTHDFTSDLKSKLESLTSSATVDYSHMATLLQEHEDDVSIHVTDQDRALVATIGQKANATDVVAALATKAELTTLSGHISNTSVHVTQADKDKWNNSEAIVVSDAKPSSGMWYQIIL